MGNDKHKSFTFAFSLVQSAYWMTACAILAYQVVYLQALSFNNFQTGIIIASGEVLGALFGPTIATYLDGHPKFPTSRMNTPLILLLILIHGVLMLIGRNNLLTGAMVAVVYGLFLSTNSVNMRYCGDSAVAGLSLDYGFARGMGSLAYVIPCTLIGIIFEKISARYLPLIAILLLILQMAANFYAGRFFKGQHSVNLHRKEAGDPLFAFIRSDPTFARLLIGNALLFFGTSTYETFMINVVNNVGGSTSTMGVLSAFGAAMELPAMFLLTRLRKKWRVSTLLTFAFTAFSVKSLLFAIVNTVPGLFAAMALTGLGYALYAAAIVVYVEDVIPLKNQAKGQSLIYTMEMLGAIANGLIAGRLYDVTSVKTTLLVGSAVSVIGTVLSISGIKKVR